MSRKTWFLAALAMQVAVLCWVAVPRLIVLHTGRSALLRTIPVDPRDPFRGDYVVLNYEVSEVPAGTAKAGDTVFTIIEEKDGFAKAVRFVTERPTGGELYLQGKIEERWGSLRARYGIEAFFVPEGRGLVYERQRNHDARVRISSRGFAVLEALVKRPGVDPDNENGGTAATAPAKFPTELAPEQPHVRELDGTSRQFVSLAGYQAAYELLAVLRRHHPDQGHGSRDIDTFYREDGDSVRLLLHLPPVKPPPGRALTRARLLIAVPPDRTLEVRPVPGSFGAANQTWARQLEAPTWDHRRYPKEKWAKPGVLGSSDAGAVIATLAGSEELQGIDVTEIAKGSAGAPFGLMFSWAHEPAGRPRRPARVSHDQLGHMVLELSYAK